jgi:hypothetical protein
MQSLNMQFLCIHLQENNFSHHNLSKSIMSLYISSKKEKKSHSLKIGMDSDGVY